jgi:hypothetical protein
MVFCYSSPNGPRQMPFMEDGGMACHNVCYLLSNGKKGREKDKKQMWQNVISWVLLKNIQVLVILFLHIICVLKLFQSKMWKG